MQSPTQEPSDQGRAQAGPLGNASDRSLHTPNLATDNRDECVSSATPPQRRIGHTERRRVILAAVVGSFVEWFEFSVYGYLAAVMGSVFFPTESPSAQLIASLAAFGVAFLARPFGGFLFGPIGDRLGRKRVLTTTIVLMAVATFGIGLIPSYAAIGIAAPTLLVALRLLQGLSAGGEASGASIYVTEYCSDKRRTFHSSFIEVGCMSGFLFGAVITAGLKALCTPAQMTEWAWRVPFMLALPLGAIGLYIRYRLEETPAFEASRQQRAERGSGFDWRELFSTHLPELLQSSGLIIVTNVTLFIVVTYVPTYLVSNLHLSAGVGLTMTLVAQAMLICSIPFSGRLADRIGRKQVMLIGTVGVALCAIPCFHMLIDGSYPVKLLGLIILNACLSCLLSCIYAKVPALFHTDMRFTGMAVSYNVSVALFAGTAPMLNAWLINLTGSHLIPAYYLIGGALFGVLALIASTDRTGEPMPGDAPLES